MSKEVLQPMPGKEPIRRRKILPATLRSVVLAGSIIALTATHNDSANASPTESQNYYFPPPITIVTKEALTNLSAIQISPISTAESNQEQEETKSKNETISDFLKNNYARAGLAAILGMAVSLTINAHQLGKRHDENKLHALRVAGPLLMAASASSALIDSFITIDGNIPISLFVASTLITGSHQIINTFQHYKNPKIRAAAVSTATMFASFGVTALIAFNR